MKNPAHDRGQLQQLHTPFLPVLFAERRKLRGGKPFLNGWHYIDREIYAGKNPEKPKGRKKSK